MVTISVAVEIDAPRDRVWNVLEPIERHVDWMADAESITFLTDQTRGIGTSFSTATVVGPIRLDDKMVITEWEAPTRMGVRHEGVVSGSGVFELASLDFDRRTRLTWTEQLSFPWYLGGRLGEVVGGRGVLTQIWRRNLNRLRQHIEQSPAPSPDHERNDAHSPEPHHGPPDGRR